MHLTPRERQIVREVALGAEDKEIAFKLGISFNTVRGYMSHIRGKSGISSRALWVALALREGIVTKKELFALLPK
jgi:DNA-binding NarL/FixJ family response regulator